MLKMIIPMNNNRTILIKKMRQKLKLKDINLFEKV